MVEAVSTGAILAIVIVAVLVVIVILVAVAMMARNRRTHGLQRRFGSEYDRTVDQADGRRAAERDLRNRADRRDELEFRPLSREDQERFREQWEHVQSRFVDRPQLAASEADDLVEELMRERGYPVGDFDEQRNLVSVDHPDLVENYQQAHSVAVESREGHADTESLRRALVAYRSLFDELLADANTGGDRRESGS